jgi:phosphoglycerate dehydrogenase-like enzyme
MVHRKARAKARVHFKSNRWAADTWPNTPEGEAAFSLTPERYAEAARRHPAIARRIAPSFGWNTEDFAAAMRDVEVLVTWDLPTRDLESRAPRLKWIHIIGAGVEHLMPMDWLPRGVTLTNNKGVHAAKAGEYGLMSLLMLNASMPALQTHQRAKRFEQLYATPIVGKTVVVVGVGSIGGAVARAAKRAGLRVLGVSRHGRKAPGVDRMYRTRDIDKALAQADFVFVATPLTGETRNLLDARRLDLLKPTAGLVNVGREPVIDYAALARKLRDGTLAGAILDVFDPEPLPPTSPLWDTPNLIVTPHVSSDDGASYIPLTLDLFFDNMGRYLAGRPLLNRVNAKLGY